MTWHSQAQQLEVASQDPNKGTVFYVLKNDEDIKQPQFDATHTRFCAGCHCHNEGIVRAPTLFVERSSLSNEVQEEFLPSKDARRFGFGGFQTHSLPSQFRWMGFGVSGDSASVNHRGTRIDPTEFADQYLTGTSDIVAHLIFDHQATALNLLSRLSQEHHLNVRSKIDEMTVRYLLLADEAAFDKPSTAPSAFAARYESRGVKAENGRSLRELDLQHRLFRHRISPVVQSRMVREFPRELRMTLFQRLNAVLSGRQKLSEYSISEIDRDATLSVLRSTVPDWPRE